MSLSPHRLTAAMSAAMQLLAELPEDDERLRLDTIAGETDALELMDQIAEQVIADEALAERAKARAKRLEERADQRRAIIKAMMEALELREPLQRPLYTASLRYTAKPLIIEAETIPAPFWRHAPDLLAIGKALRNGEPVPGAELSNPMPTLTLRTA